MQFEFDINQWLTLLTMWFHVMAGITWIGTSFLFVWLDNHLQPQVDGGPGHVGKAWLFHGGGYYQVDKALVAPESVLSALHWFKWEAYLTWISGFALLCVLYFWNAGAFMVDPAVADIGVGTAIGIGIGTLIVAWLIYDVLWRALGERSPGVAKVLSFAFYLFAIYALTHLLSGRAAYIMSGAMLGTIMAANVLFIIQPRQRQMFEANRRGETPDERWSRDAKQRSTHNNYLTLPVVFMMISNHFAMTFGHAYNWLVLAALFFIGVGVDHYLNTRDKGQKKWGYAAVGGAFAGLVAVVIFTAVPMGAATGMATESPVAGNTGRGQKVAFEAVHQIVNRRCAACHSAHPSSPMFSAPPMGIRFDSPDAIKHLAPRIKALAVDSHTMPLANRTNMTDGERRTLGRWIAQGANIDTGAGQ